MAYIAGRPYDEAENQAPTGTASLTAESGQFSPSSQNESVRTGSAPVGQDRGGSAAPNVSKYLQANAPQAQRLASRIGQSIVSQGNQARSDLNQAQSQFNQGVSPYEGGVNQDILNRASRDPLSLFNWNGQQATPAPAATQARQNRPQNGQRPQHNYAYNIQQAQPQQGARPRGHQRQQPQQPAQNPWMPPTVRDQGAVDYLTNLRNQTYQGPQGLSGEAYTRAQSGAAAANNASQALQSDEGRLAALRAISGQQHYSYMPTGGNYLDNALLQGRGAQGVLNQAASQNADLSNMGAADTAAQARAQAAQANLGANQAALQGAFSNAYPNYQADIAARQAAANAAQRGGHGRGRNQAAPSVVNDEDRARIYALNQLMGTNYAV